MLSPRRAPIERRSGSQYAHAYDDEDCREDRPQHLVRHPRTQMAAEEDAGQRANDERTQQYPIDRSQKPVADARDQGQRHGMGDVGANETGDRDARITATLRAVSARRPSSLALAPNGREP